MSRKWKRPSSQQPPEGVTPPAKAGSSLPIVLSVLAGIALGVLAVVALSLWGGGVGRVIVAALGFTVAGLLLPWLAIPAVSGSDNTAGCILGTLSVICGVIGLGVGIWYGVSNEEMPWWAYAGAGTAAALAGGITGGLMCAWVLEPKKPGEPGNPPA